MLTIETPVQTREGDRTRVTGRVHGDGLDCTVWFDSPGELHPAPEAFVAASLMVAMSRAEPLTVRPAISRRFLAGLEQIQQIWCAWYPDLRRVPILATETTPPDTRATPTGTAAFFSAGVDAFATALAHQREDPLLVLIRGFDLPLGKARVWHEVLDHSQVAASELGLRLQPIETNVRELVDQGGYWGRTYGGALASVGLLLQTEASRFYVPSSHDYADLMPSGSHALVDPCWSTEAMQFVYDGGG